MIISKTCHKWRFNWKFKIKTAPALIKKNNFWKIFIYLKNHSTRPQRDYSAGLNIYNNNVVQKKKKYFTTNISQQCL